MSETMSSSVTGSATESPEAAPQFSMSEFFSNFLTDVPVSVYSHARALNYMVQSEVLNLVARTVIPGYKRQRLSFTQMESVRKAAFALIEQDRKNIENAIYPLEVLTPESPLQHWTRFPRLLLDSLKIGNRRVKGRTTEFQRDAAEMLDELPRYYRRNFHFQSDGYLSSQSAELYEHQVEVLFAGMADAMRRSIIAPMKKHFGCSDGKGMTFLELGAGTGRASRFVSQAFPKAKIIATDLSPAYLRVGQKRLADFQRVNFLQAHAEKLPFRKGQFDAVYSVFLFHELPLAERQAVLKESVRVAKPMAFVGMVDSLQNGDVPEFNPMLENFPTAFHEPFYRNYCKTPMVDLFREARLDVQEQSTAFFSKMIAARTPVEAPGLKPSSSLKSARKK